MKTYKKLFKNVFLTNRGIGIAVNSNKKALYLNVALVVAVTALIVTLILI